MSIPLRVLMIEDSEIDAGLIIHKLKKADFSIRFERVETADKMMAALKKEEWDFIIADYSLPSFDATSALLLFKQTGLDIPFIVISGAIGEEIAISLMKSGAHDYLMKDNLARLPEVVKRELQEFHVRRDHKLAEKALKESEDMYRTLLNASPEGIIILDTWGSITDVSNIALVILGYENKTKLIGKPFLQFTSPEEKDKINELLQKTVCEGLAQNVEIRLKRSDLTEINGEISITLIMDSEGKPKTYMAIIRDISQRKKLEQQLIHTERMASLGEMATGIAHEINQPLNTITMSIENIFHEIQTKKAIGESYFLNKSNKIFENVTRIKKIIDHVRAFSRDHDEYLHSSFDIRDSIRNALSMVAEQFNHRSIELINEFDDLAIPIIGNTYKFEQVILNLLMNAKDAIEEKRKMQMTEEVSFIRIRTMKKDETILIEVEDNGIGIKGSELNKIMLPFYSTKEVGKGTGLGLSISFGIIKEMNGNIEVKSEEYRGTTMQIIVPVRQGIVKAALNNSILNN